jgi:hypothetical protein
MYALGPPEWVAPEDGDRIQSPKRRVFKLKAEIWIMSRTVIGILICHRHKPIELINQESACQRHYTVMLDGNNKDKSLKWEAGNIPNYTTIHRGRARKARKTADEIFNK